jgi:hypothetical protein
MNTSCVISVKHGDAVYIILVIQLGVTAFEAFKTQANIPNRTRLVSGLKSTMNTLVCTHIPLTVL